MSGWGPLSYVIPHHGFLSVSPQLRHKMLRKVLIKDRYLKTCTKEIISTEISANLIICILTHCLFITLGIYICFYVNPG